MRTKKLIHFFFYQWVCKKEFIRSSLLMKWIETYFISKSLMSAHYYLSIPDFPYHTSNLPCSYAIVNVTCYQFNRREKLTCERIHPDIWSQLLILCPDAFPLAMQDLLCMNNDFPPRAHCLVRWWVIVFIQRQIRLRWKS